MIGRSISLLRVAACLTALTMCVVTALAAGDGLSVTVTPPTPTGADTFDLRVSGWLPDTGYTHLDRSISVSGNQIDIDILVQDLHPQGGIFLQVLTPTGAFFDDFGPLSAGSYDVSAELWLAFWPNTSPDYLYMTGSLAFDVLAAPILPGDYNDDGTVDAADYCVWRDNLNTSAELPNDETPGEVNDADIAVWRAHFGQSLGSGSLVPDAGVPEPGSAVLLAIAGAIAAGTVLRRQLDQSAA
jgi:hypothetical protein